MNRPTKPSRALSWDGYSGVCFFNDVHMNIYRPPIIPGLKFEQIDYAPVVNNRMVLRPGTGWGKMTDVEALAADDVLARMVGAAVKEVCGP